MAIPVDTLLLLFKGLALPALIAGAVLLLAAKPWSKYPGDAPSTVAGVAAFAIAFIVADVLTRNWVQGLDDLWPVQADRRLAHVALAAFLFGGAAASDATPDWLRMILRGVVAAFGVAVLLAFMITNQWTPAEAGVWLFALTLAIAIVTTVSSAAVEDNVSIRVPAVLIVMAAGVGALLSAYASKTLAQMAGAAAAALVPFLILAWRRRHSPANAAVIDAALPVLAGLLMLGHFLLEPPVASTLLLAAVPLTLCIDRLPKLDTAPRMVLNVTTIVLALLLVGAAIAVGHVYAPAPLEPYYG